MTSSWTTNSSSLPAIPKLGYGIVFQCISSSEILPVLAFSMTLSSYLRRPLRVLIPA